MKHCILTFICILITFQHVYSNQELTNTYHEGTAYYEIFIRSFADSDGDGIGDLNGIIQKLDYLQDLGIHGIWLTPFNPSPTYHKYDIIDYASVDKEYGTIEDIKKLLKEAHKRDIKIIMDFVVNHTSSKHPWFLDALHNPSSPYRDYYLWADESESHRWESKPYNPGLPWQWHKIDDSFKQKGLYYGFFWREMPDLNYDNPKVRQEIIRYGKFWISLGIDGFRLDAAQHIYDLNEHEKSRAWWNEFRDSMNTVKPDIYLVGEIVNADSIVAGYFTGLKANFHFDLGSSIISMVSSEKVPSNFVEKLKISIQNHKHIRPDCIDAIFLTNHDQNRIMSQLSGNQKRAAMAAAIYLTLPGQPFLYYGEEIGMMGQKPDEAIRECLNWNKKRNNGTTSWREPHYNLASSISIEDAMQDTSSLYHHYKSLLSLRNSYASLLAGDIESLPSTNQVLAYSRTVKNESLIIVHNISDSEQNYPLSNYTVINSVSLGKKQHITNNVIPPFTTLILTKK